MKIAYLINRYPTVSHSFIRREIAGLRATGHSVEAFSIRSGATDLADAADRAEVERTTGILEAGGAALLWVTLCTIATGPRRFAKAFALAVRSARADRSRGWRHLVYLVEACWLARRLRGTDHLHAHFGTNPAAVARLVSRLSGLPYSFTVHGPDEFDEPAALDLRGKVRDAAMVAGVSAFGRSQLMRWSDPADWHKIQIVRCGVDATFLDEPPPRAPVRPLLCCIARLSAQKGIPLLIEAAARLKADGDTFELVLVGDGEMRAAIDQLIIARALSDTVTITGYVDAARVRDALLSARAMVLPSFAEGLPVVVMEALALRTPVIVSAIAGTPELVDAACGWLIPAGSIDALVAAMRAALAASPEALRAMGEAGRARVLERHDSARNAADLARLFQRG